MNEIKQELKKIQISFLDILLLVLLLVNILMRIFPSFDLKVKMYTHNIKHQFLKPSQKEVEKLEVYFNQNHPNCFLTKESINNKQSCIKSNGVWYYNSKQCVCRILEVG